MRSVNAKIFFSNISAFRDPAAESDTHRRGGIRQRQPQRRNLFKKFQSFFTHEKCLYPTVVKTTFLYSIFSTIFQSGRVRLSNSS